jgi:hypothetical protein
VLNSPGRAAVTRFMREHEGTEGPPADREPR